MDPMSQSSLKLLILATPQTAHQTHVLLLCTNPYVPPFLPLLMPVLSHTWINMPLSTVTHCLAATSDSFLLMLTFQ